MDHTFGIIRAIFESSSISQKNTISTPKFHISLGSEFQKIALIVSKLWYYRITSKFQVYTSCSSNVKNPWIVSQFLSHLRVWSDTINIWTVFWVQEWKRPELRGLKVILHQVCKTLCKPNFAIPMDISMSKLHDFSCYIECQSLKVCWMMIWSKNAQTKVCS